MTSTNIIFMIHMRNKYNEKLNKIKQDQDKEKLDKDRENQDKENLKNCKVIFKNYLNYLEKSSIKTFESMELHYI